MKSWEKRGNSLSGVHKTGPFQKIKTGPFQNKKIKNALNRFFLEKKNK